MRNHLELCVVDKGVSYRSRKSSIQKGIDFLQIMNLRESKSNLMSMNYGISVSHSHCFSRVQTAPILCICFPFILSFWSPLFFVCHPITSPAPHNTILCSRPALHRHTLPLVPGAGHDEMMQFVTHFLHGNIAFVCVRINRKATFLHNLVLWINNKGDKTLLSILRHGAPHSHLSSLVH